MAIQSFMVDPNHVHSYIKIIAVGCDSDPSGASPQWKILNEDGTVSGVNDGGAILRAIGLIANGDTTDPAG